MHDIRILVSRGTVVLVAVLAVVLAVAVVTMAMVAIAMVTMALVEKEVISHRFYKTIRCYWYY